MIGGERLLRIARGWATATLLAALPLPGHPALAQEQQERETASPQAAPQAEGVAYTVSIEGDLEPELKSLLEQSSQLVALQEQPPATMAALRRRTTDDLKRLDQALRSEAFYGNRLASRFDETSDPVVVTIEVETGPLYLLADYRVIYETARPDPDPAADLEQLGLQIGMAARAPSLVEAQQTLIRRFEETGHPLADVKDRRVVVDHAETTMTVELRVDAGSRASFGPLSIEGVAAVDEDYLRGLLPWQEGEIYDQRKVEEARRALSRTDLFESIRIDHADQVADDGALPITIALAERDHRTLGAGANFSTSEGPGGQVFWEHRNLFGANERFRLSLKAALIDQRLKAEFRKPDYLRLDQDLLADGTLLRQDTDAFEEESARAFIGLEREFGELWRVSGGGAVEFTRVTEFSDEEEPSDGDVTENFLLYSMPMTASRDSSDNLLNPTEGTKLRLAVAPYFGTLEQNVFFLSTELSGSAYLSLDQEDRYVLAGRGRVGSIVGADTQTLPASKRFYSGGGGSVRGYEFQSIGPENAKGDPSGGRSVMELGAEIRVRVTEDIGIVPFVEGGIIGEEPFVDFSEEFLWAAGLGLRYFTAVGPLRLDVAFPINGRDSDDVFQFYISLGQAF